MLKFKIINMLFFLSLNQYMRCKFNMHKFNTVCIIIAILFIGDKGKQ